MIFFDLEYYVPKNSRDTIRSLKYNPNNHNNIILGGCFCTPCQYSNQDIESVERNLKGIWIWNYKNEKEMLIDIKNLFDKDFEITKGLKLKANTKQIVTNMVYGIGIARSDIPALYIRSNINEVAPSNQLFDTYFKINMIDFSQIFAPSVSSDIIYPATHNEILSHIRKSRDAKENGANVWSLYENGNFDAIEARCKKEVIEIVEIYHYLLKNRLKI